MGEASLANDTVLMTRRLRVELEDLELLSWKLIVSRIIRLIADSFID